MDISVIKAVSDWLEYELETGNPDQHLRVKFKVHAVDPLYNFNFGNKPTPSVLYTALVIDAVEDWDLTDGEDGPAIPVTPETKQKYLPALMRFIVRGAGQFLGRMLFDYACSSENFLKNS